MPRCVDIVAIKGIDGSLFQGGKASYFGASVENSIHRCFFMLMLLFGLPLQAAMDMLKIQCAGTASQNQV